MNFKRLFALLMFFCIAIMPALAQEKIVTGKVTDSKDGSPLANVTIQVKGSKIATQTAPDGTFKLKVAGESTLVFSSIGFAKQEFSSNSASFDVSLVQSNAALNEVVVVAYGTRKKTDLTGAVTAISAKDFQKGNINSSEQLLQGKVAGLQITSGGGSAGGGSRIRIRGGASLYSSNEPLLVIDGVPVDGNGLGDDTKNLLSTINPDDIESMSVLKDASATALYGSRASNGVIIITTKKGTKGAVKFNFNSKFSVGYIPKKVDVFTGDEIRKIITDEAAATGISTFKDQLGKANTDWQKEIYQASVGTDNNISASGSLLKIPFRVSLGYLNQTGLLKTNTFDRISYGVNLSPKFFKDALAVNFNAKYAHTDNRIADEGAIGSALAFDPTQPAKGVSEYLQPDGKPIDLATRNPIGLLNLKNNTQHVDRLITNIQLDYKLSFLPDLHVLMNLGLDNAYGYGKTVIDSTSATNYKTAGYKKKNEQQKINMLADFSLFYSKELKNINSKIDVLVAHSYQDFYTKVYNFAAYSQFPDSTIPNSTPLFATDKPEYILESYLGRVNFSFANKYLLTASIRRDASSKFNNDNRVGYFPSVALAWKIKEEFFKGNNSVTDLKLRLGWGITGQQDINDGKYYPALARYTKGTNSAQYQFGTQYYNVLRPVAYDKNIKWETTTTNNLGLDFAFFNNRISGSIDVYKKNTKDLIANNIPIAPGANFDIALTTNVGNIENKGVEFSLNTGIIRNKDWSWDFGFNIAYNENKITNLLKNQDPNFKGIPVSGLPFGTGNNIGKHNVGYAPYVFFMKKQVYNASGKPIEGLFEDLNRDGVVDDNDRYYYKKPAPDVLLGTSTQVSYKEWSVGLAGHGSFGGYLYNAVNAGKGNLSSIKTSSGVVGNAVRNYNDTKFLTNQSALSDYFLENASFYRLDNINIGYSVGKVFKNKANLKLNASVQNVFVITKYKGLDPEVSSDSGIDNTIYPRPRIITLGFNLDF